MQILIGFGLLVLGISLWADDRLVLAATLVLLGFGVINGACRDAWVSFDLSGLFGSGSDGDGGGGD